jgi:hypothetical protein|nr:hypothetical protein [uncultured Flavobacterium sp.]
MKKLPLLPQSLEHFIKHFLPEGTLRYNENLELRSIAGVIERFFHFEDHPTAIQRIFEVFYKLHYPMSVVEPLEEGNILQPYIVTNSRRIYIAIDFDKLHQINKLSKILVTEDPIIPCELKNTFNLFQEFLK